MTTLYRCELEIDTRHFEILNGNVCEFARTEVSTMEARFNFINLELLTVGQLVNLEGKEWEIIDVRMNPIRLTKVLSFKRKKDKGIEEEEIGEAKKIIKEERVKEINYLEVQENNSINDLEL